MPPPPPPLSLLQVEAYMGSRIQHHPIVKRVVSEYLGTFVAQGGWGAGWTCGEW